MKYKKKNMDQVFQDKNWVGVKQFTDKYPLDLLILLDNVVKSKDWEKLKEFVKAFSIKPVLEYGLPVGGEGIKELYEISEKFHGHKDKIGAEWWLQEEIEGAVRQLKGFGSNDGFQEKIAFLWKEADSAIDAPGPVKSSAFKKILLSEMLAAIYRAASEEENRVMTIMHNLFEQMRFHDGLDFRDEYDE